MFILIVAIRSFRHMSMKTFYCSMKRKWHRWFLCRWPRGHLVRCYVRQRIYLQHGQLNTQCAVGAITAHAMTEVKLKLTASEAVRC